MALLTTILTGLFSILAAIIGVFGKEIFMKKSEDKQKKVTIQTVRDIHRQISQLRQSVKANYAGLLLYENGNVRDSEANKFITLIDESYIGDDNLAIHNLKRFKVDKDFRDAVKACLDSQKYLLIDSTRLDDSFLQRSNFAGNQKAIILLPIIEEEKRLWIILMRFQDIPEITPSSINSFEVVKFHLGKLIEENPDLVS